MSDYQSPLDAAKLAALRALLQARESQGGEVSRAELVRFAREVSAEEGWTIDFSAEEDLGHPMVVLRPPERAQDARFEALSNREREVAEQVALGLRNKEIAKKLHISVATVKDHVHQILRKTGLSSRTEVIAVWRK